MTQNKTPLLEVRRLDVGFPHPLGMAYAVRDLSFTLLPGETMCLVGESGSGKSMTGLALLRLIPEPGIIAAGSILFEGEDLLKAPEARLRALRGANMSMVFQEPMTALNPVLRVGEQVSEAIRLHRGLDKKTARKQVIELFRQVGIPAPESRIDDYAHQLSGGMRQRVSIAMALSCKPKLIIADEPTTALDVSIQGQILQLLREQAKQGGTAVLLITHNLGVVAEAADTVAVMYAGRFMEYAPVRDFFAEPLHPYSLGLMAARPNVDSDPNQPLTAIPGHVPALTGLPFGCVFHDRCAAAIERCRREEPPLRTPDGRPERLARCWLHY